jgi:predicted Zn-dependent protease with MMP-like domain
MISVTDEEFEIMVAAGIDAIPEEFASKMDNVAVTWDETPSWRQRTRLHLPPWRTLFGLYEGVAKTRRGSNYTMVLPDKITVFKGPLSSVATSKHQLAQMVKNTVWHEVGHHFGLSDAEIARRQHQSEQT